MTIAQIKQWFHVMPLFELLQEKWSLVAPYLFKPVAIAMVTAQEISEGGELSVKRTEQHIGYVSMLVYSPTKKKQWWVNIRPIHFPGYFPDFLGPCFDFSAVRCIEFSYSPKGLTNKNYRTDPSTYLSVKKMR